MTTGATHTHPPEGASTATRILDAAEELFAERGFAAVSVREIAGRVGLNQASIYNHFASKQALYEAVLERGLRPLREILAQAAQAPLTPERGDRLVEQLVDQLWRTPHLPKLVQREMLDDGEYFERLCENWLKPIYDQGRRAMAAMARTTDQADWPDDQLPLAVVGMYHLLFGNFTAAALLERVIGVDPMAPEMRRIHVEFLKSATRRMRHAG